MSVLARKEEKEFRLKAGSSWHSFEKFRQEGAKALESIKNGLIGILHTKTGQYRILEESDFQKLYGLACDVHRLQGGLRIVISAAHAVKRHPEDLENINLLLETVTLLGGSSPALPTREKFEPIVVETTGIDEEDEVVTDPEELESLIRSESLAQL